MHHALPLKNNFGILFAQAIDPLIAFVIVHNGFFDISLNMKGWCG